VAKWLGAPLGGGVTTATRAKDSDRQDTCRLLDEALNNGEITMSEHDQRVSSATHAVTMGDLHILVSDLQNRGGRARLSAKPSAPSRHPGLLAAAFVVSVLLGVGIGWGLFGSDGALAGDPGAKPDGIAPVVLTPPTQLHSLGGLTGLIDQARKKFGDVVGYELIIYPTYAVYDRVDPKDDRRILAYDYRGGWDDPRSDTKSGGDGSVAVDLSKFDIPATVGILRGAPDSLHIKQSDVKSTYLIIRPGKDPMVPGGGLTMSVYVSSDYGSGYIEFAGDGSIKRINPPS
jgi:hypothetical protein